MAQPTKKVLRGGARSDFLTKEKIAQPSFVKKGQRKKKKDRLQSSSSPPSQSSLWIAARVNAMPVGVQAAATVSNKGGPAAATMMPCTSEPDKEDKEDYSANLGGPSSKYHCLIPNLRIARPKNFFNTQLTPNYMGVCVCVCVSGLRL